MAIRNALDAQSLIDSAEGAQAEMTNILIRMRELAIQSANDTNSNEDRLNLNLEVSQLISELDRIATVTTWAGIPLLDGSFVSRSFQIGAGADQAVQVTQGSMKPGDIGEHVFDTTAVASEEDETAANTVNGTEISVLGKGGSAEAAFLAGSSAAQVAAAVNADTPTTGVTAKAHTAVRFTLDADPTSQTSFTLQGGGSAVTITTTVTDNADLTSLMTTINAFSGTSGVTAEFDGTDKSKLIFREANGDNITISDFSATTASGATAVTATVEKQSNFAGTTWTTGVTLTRDDTGGAGDDSTVVTGVVRMSSTEAFSVSGFGTDDTEGYNGTSDTAASTLSKVSNISISTQAGAAASLGVIDTALTAVNTSRAKLGAVSNRLEMTVTNLTNIVTNLSEGRGRIEDADFAAESTELARTQILQQASMAMLSQANASKQSVMGLLQGR
jgi:flagellin